MNGIILGLLYGSVLKVDIVYIVNGCFVVGGFFVASSASLLFRRPWIYATAVEVMPPERLQEIRGTPEGIAIFKDIMTALTMLWTALFFAMFCINLGCTIWKLHGGSQAATQITSIIAIVSTVTVGVRCLQPRVIEMSKQQAMERLSSNSTSAV
jgi:hypothetical protein